MVFGIQIQAIGIEVGGIVLLLLFGAAVVLGIRAVKIPGLTPGKKLRIHKAVAFTAIAFALVHAFMGFVLLNGWVIG